MRTTNPLTSCFYSTSNGTVVDYDKYSTIISKGIDSIISLQNAEGTWSSIWYWYNFYGTSELVNKNETKNYFN